VKTNKVLNLEGLAIILAIVAVNFNVLLSLAIPYPVDLDGPTPSLIGMAILFVLMVTIILIAIIAKVPSDQGLAAAVIGGLGYGMLTGLFTWLSSFNEALVGVFFWSSIGISAAFILAKILSMEPNMLLGLFIATVMVIPYYMLNYELSFLPLLSITALGEIFGLGYYRLVKEYQPFTTSPSS